MLGFVLALRKQRLFKCFSGSVGGRDKAALTSTCEKMEGSAGGVGAPREALLLSEGLRQWRGGEGAGQGKGCRGHTTRLGLERTKVREEDWERNFRHRKGEGICGGTEV